MEAKRSCFGGCLPLRFFRKAKQDRDKDSNYTELNLRTQQTSDKKIISEDHSPSIERVEFLIKTSRNPEKMSISTQFSMNLSSKVIADHEILDEISPYKPHPRTNQLASIESVVSDFQNQEYDGQEDHNGVRMEISEVLIDFFNPSPSKIQAVNLERCTV